MHLKKQRPLVSLPAGEKLPKGLPESHTTPIPAASEQRLLQKACLGREPPADLTEIPPQRQIITPGQSSAYTEDRLDSPFCSVFSAEH